MEGELDQFFERRSIEATRQLHQNHRRYSHLFAVEVEPAWDDLTEEQQAAKVLALQAAAERGLVIIGA